MSNASYNIKKRITLLAVPAVALCLLIAVKLIYTSAVEGPELRKKSEALVISEREIPARRGNIYSADGKLLATSMPMYNLYMDPVAPSDKNFDSLVPKLAAGLAKLQPQRNARQWENHLRTNRSKGDRFVEIAEEQTYSQLQQYKALPLYNLGRFKGGLIAYEESYRQKPLSVAGRTIGYDQDFAQAGIEGYFSSYLVGKPGKRLMQKIGGGNWKPLNDATAIAPNDGMDVYTTIDTRIQDVANRALHKALATHKADHGCAVVMEVATGRIKAIANLGIDQNGNYVEQRNYAVWERTEPGSTFKLASLLVALEDSKVDTAMIVDTEDGIYTIHGRKVRDSNVKWGRKGGYGKITLAEAFRKSSNTGIVKAVYGAYKDSPEDFVDQLYNMGLQHKTGILIKGESAPKIPKPTDKNWSGVSLPWMAFGYEVSFTPLQILAFYNAIANNGVYVKPQLVTNIKQHGHDVKKFRTEVINPGICSKETVKELQALLRGVVTRGTATNLNSDKLAIAGKTGTSQLNYWKSTREYQASFAGYFPADDPKFSCIVVVNKPDPSTGYYGGTVAGPVVKAIAEEVYLSLPETLTPAEGIEEWHLASIESREQALQKNYLPNLQGLTAMQAISLLENYNINVRISGSGRVKTQHPRLGARLNKNMTVELNLR